MPVLSRSFDGARDSRERARTPSPENICVPATSRGVGLDADRRARPPPREREKPRAPGRTRPPPPSIRASPRTPTLRANPYPEVTDPICRFPLPTFFHRLEAVHLGDLMRISVRASASVHLRSPPTRFSRAGLETTTDPAETRGSSGWAFLRPVSATLSPRDGIPGFRSLKQKRKLFPGFRAASLVCVALPRP